MKSTYPFQLPQIQKINSAGSVRLYNRLKGDYEAFTVSKFGTSEQTLVKAIERSNEVLEEMNLDPLRVLFNSRTKTKDYPYLFNVCIHPGASVSIKVGISKASQEAWEISIYPHGFEKALELASYEYCRRIGLSSNELYAWFDIPKLRKLETNRYLEFCSVKGIDSNQDVVKCFGSSLVYERLPRLLNLTISFDSKSSNYYAYFRIDPRNQKKLVYPIHKLGYKKALEMCFTQAVSMEIINTDLSSKLLVSAELWDWCFSRLNKYVSKIGIDANQALLDKFHERK